MTIFFISGSARVGKSTLYRALHKNFEGDCVELDPLLSALIKYQNLPEVHPINNKFTIEAGQTFESWLDCLIEKDTSWWPFLREWVEEHNNYGSDFLFVGIVWPHLLKEINTPHRAVFLVDTSEDHIERAVQIAHQGGQFNNWQADWPEEKIRQWGRFNVERARYFMAQAELYNYPVFDVAVHGYEASQLLAHEALLGERVA